MSKDDDDPEAREEIYKTIAPIIMSFHQVGLEFHGEELQRYVRERCNCAPASPDRILRAMRRRGALDYVVLHRRQSHYLFV